MATAVLAAVSAAFGQAAPTIRVEQVPSANPDQFIIDISETVDTAAGDSWTVGGILGSLTGGAAFVYAIDPNSGRPVLTATDPVGQGRDITMVSKPRAQNQNSRFRSGGAPEFLSSLEPPGPPFASASHVNIGFAEAPPIGTQGSGYITRLAIDISATAFSADALSIVLADPGPDNSILVGNAATASSSFPGLTRLDFWVVVPEPASLVLLALGGLIAARRR